MLDPDLEELLAAAWNVQGKFPLTKDFAAGSVAAAVRSISGKIYTGICIDIACGIGFCAEHSAIAEMLKHREMQIDSIVAVGKGQVLAPCGRCRELMALISDQNMTARIILHEKRVATLRDLLPEHWLDLKRTAAKDEISRTA